LGCRFWDTGSSEWKADGVALASVDGNGHAVCSTTHLTDFAVVTSVLDEPDAFYTPTVELELELPQAALSGEDALSAFAELTLAVPPLRRWSRP
jgi:hypothetical protein